MNVSSIVQQGLNGLAVATVCRPHQGCPASVVPRMDVGLVVQQGLNGLAVATECRIHQGCHALVVSRMDVGPIVQQGLNGLAVIFYCRQHQSCRACFFIVCTGIRAKPLKRDSEEEKHSEQKNNAEYSHATNSVETKGALAGFMPVQPKRNGNDRRRHFPRPPLASPARPSPSCGHGHFHALYTRRRAVTSALPCSPYAHHVLP